SATRATTAASLTCSPSTQTARKSAPTSRSTSAGARGSEHARSASNGLNGWNAGGFSATPRRAAFRRLFRTIQRVFAGISAGPSWPCASSSPANSTGTGSIVAPWRAQSAGSCVHARYAFGETTSKWKRTVSSAIANHLVQMAGDRLEPEDVVERQRSWVVGENVQAERRTAGVARDGL